MWKINSSISIRRFGKAFLITFHSRCRLEKFLDIKIDERIGELATRVVYRDKGWHRYTFNTTQCLLWLFVNNFQITFAFFNSNFRD